MAANQEDFCQRCGEFALGRTQWMFHQELWPVREFYCVRCQHILRIYGYIGMTLLLLILSGAIIATCLLLVFR